MTIKPNHHMHDHNRREKVHSRALKYRTWYNSCKFEADQYTWAQPEHGFQSNNPHALLLYACASLAHTLHFRHHSDIPRNTMASSEWHREHCKRVKSASTNPPIQRSGRSTDGIPHRVRQLDNGACTYCVPMWDRWARRWRVERTRARIFCMAG